MTEETNPQMTAEQAFYHLFQIAKHDGETDVEFIERGILRDTLEKQIKEAGLTPPDLLKTLNTGE